MAPDRQTQRKIARLLQAEARWLQKTLFALHKAIEAQSKLAEETGEQTAVLGTRPGAEVTLQTLESLLEVRVEQVRESLASFGPGAF